MYHWPPDAVWPYWNPDGTFAFAMCRWNAGSSKQPDRKKDFRPLSQGHKSGKRSPTGWQLADPPDLKLLPLFNADAIAARPDVTVVVCEGEKAATAMQDLFPTKYVATTSAHGSGSANRSDWSLLAGRCVVICPDNDLDGAKYARAVGNICAALKCGVLIVDIAALAAINPIGGQRAAPDKWDVADAVKQWSDWDALRKDIQDCTKQFDPPQDDRHSKSAKGSKAAGGHEEPWSEQAQSRLQSALAPIPATNRDVWLKVGFALHNLQQCDAHWPAEQIWEDWSRTCPEKFSEGDQNQTWAWFSRSPASGEPVTVATIYHLAKENGWVDPLRGAASGNDDDPAALAFLEEACAAIVDAKRGEQELTLHKKCFEVGGLVGAKQLREETARARLIDAAHAMPAHGEPWGDLTEKVSASLKRGMEEPWVPYAPPLVPRAGINFARYKRTDAGNALAFLDLFGENLRYVEKWKSFLMWTGTRWREATDLEMLPLARVATEEMIKWAMGQAEGDMQNACYKHALATQNVKGLRAMVNLAKGEGRVRIEPDILDANSWLLGCPNGTIDLKTGELRDARREDYITKQIGVPYDPAATCPSWDKLLAWTCDDDKERAPFLQEVSGYTLTGEVSEELLFLVLGGGDNLKTTVVMTLQDLLGDYASTARSDLLVHDQGKEGAASPDVAALQGKRLITISETEDGCHLSEARVKDITSNKRISARRLHGNPFTFMPTHKTFLDTNYRPRVTGTDKGIWRRLALIEFKRTIEEKKRNIHFREQFLRPELSGILNWALAGLKRWREWGKLILPKSVRSATETYRNEQDLIAQWVEECIVEDPKTREKFATLYDGYVGWLGKSGRPLGRTRFCQELDRLGFSAIAGPGNVKYRSGLRFRNLSDDAKSDAQKPKSDAQKPLSDEKVEWMWADRDLGYPCEP